MPIRFEQPQPYAPAISSGYGRAMAQAQGNPVLARLAEAAASQITQRDQFDREMAARVGAQNADRYAQAMAGNYDRATRADQANADRTLSAAGLQQSGRQADAQRQFQSNAITAELQAQADRTQFLADAESAQGRERFNQALMLQDNQLSAAEHQRMQRLEMAKTVIARQVDQNEITPEVGQQLLVEVANGLSPLKAKAAYFQSQQEQVQYQRQMQEAARLATIQEQNAKFRSAGFPGRMISFTDPTTGTPITGWMDDAGKFTQAKHEQPEKTVGGLTMKQFDDIYRSAQQRVDKLTKDEFGEDKPGWDDAKREEALANDVKKRIAAIQEHFGTGGQGGGQGQQGPPSPAGMAGGQAPETPKREPAKPFDLGKPDTWAPDQRAAVGANAAMKQMIVSRPDLDDRTKRRAVMAADTMMLYLSQYGSYENMPRADREAFNQMVKILDAIPEPKGPPKEMPQQREKRRLDEFTRGRQGLRRPSEY